MVSPARELEYADIQGVAFDAHQGSMGALRNHADMIGLLGIGELHFTDNNGKLLYYSISGGFFEVRDNVLLVLADAVERADE
ncbi:MAG: F0F1 ATP synthase subunit epsilon [Planctomycetota bacterium]|nr:F0F1 ATP synthase subunit epsilon [Planctomycetota bacterium]